MLNHIILIIIQILFKYYSYFFSSEILSNYKVLSILLTKTYTKRYSNIAGTVHILLLFYVLFICFVET